MVIFHSYVNVYQRVSHMLHVCNIYHHLPHQWLKCM